MTLFQWRMRAMLPASIREIARTYGRPRMAGCIKVALERLEAEGMARRPAGDFWEDKWIAVKRSETLQ